MLCRVILMRHAKSSWKSGATDHRRPLNKRGRSAARLVAKELKSRDWMPDKALLSDATRAQETLQRMQKVLGKVSSELHPEFYEGACKVVRSALKGLDSDVSTVLVIGHNPGWEDTLTWLTGKEEWLKAGSAALLTQETKNWGHALRDKHRFKLARLVHPRDL